MRGGYTREWDVGGWAACIREVANAFTHTESTHANTHPNILLTCMDEQISHMGYHKHIHTRNYVC